MSKKILWLVVSGLMALSLVMAACGPAAVEEKKPAPVVEEKKPAPAGEEKKQEVAEKEVVKPTAEVPEYGGTLTIDLGADVRGFDSVIRPHGADNHALTQQGLWSGDWAKGAAGGYGTNETNWRTESDRFDHKAGHIAESTKWTVDWEKNEGTIIYQIRRGIHWALNPASEASRLVGGREVTVDDVVSHLRLVTTYPKAYIYLSNIELRNIQITKTGSWEVTVKVPQAAVLVTAVSRLGDSTYIQPPEVVAKYGNMENWRNSIGTGPFMLTDYIAGSASVMVRNPNFWMKDPVGPGKGNQLPYLDRVRYLIIPDASTRQAALRTGKIDQMSGISMEDAAQIRKTAPALLEVETPGGGGGSPIGMRTDKAELPFKDIRVRRAMMMAIDFEAINQSLFAGRGRLITWPYGYSKDYAALYVGLDDPEFPESVRELYTYNPEKARQLLKEAGYPNGFKTSLILTANEVDYNSIIKNMWAKVGIDLTLDVRDTGVKSAINTSRTHEALATGAFTGPVAPFYLFFHLTGQASPNGSMIDDPYVNEMIVKVRRAAVTDLNEAMRITKEITKYALDQAWVIPSPSGISYRYWWPWLKNYSGETNVGYFGEASWPQYIWYDKALKKSMGY